MGRREKRARWWSAAFVLILSTATPQASAADIEPRAGTATFTDLTGGGTCSFPGEPPDNLHVGISTAEYGTADVCGAYLEVRGPKGTVRVQITDHCVRCRAGLIDVTRKAFTQIADVSQGRVPVSYALARNPPLAVPISLRVKAGSSRWWFQIQVLDHGNPLRSVELATGPASWRPLIRTFDNFWTASRPGPGDGPFTLRITDIYGQNVTVYDVALAPDQIQHTVARLYQPPATAIPSAPTATSTTPPTSAPTSAAEFPPTSARPTPTSEPDRLASESTQPHPPQPTGSTGADALVSLLIVLGALTLAVWLYLRGIPRRARW